MEYFDERQSHKHGHELNVELVSKNGHSQTSLHDCLTDPFVHPFNLRLSQRAKEYLRDSWFAI